MNQTNVTLRMEPFGDSRGPIRKEINLRLSKIFKLAKNRQFELNADVTNLINSNTAWVSTYQSGPTFGFATSVMPPRIIQFGGAFEF